MTFESIMTFIIANNKLVIEVLVALVLLTIIAIAFNAFVIGGDDESAGGGLGAGSVSQLEEAIKKILEKANSVQVPAGASAADLEKLNALSSEINLLKTELEEKKGLIQKLESTPAKGGGGGDSAELQKKIGELESKLAEYEIISEDIADLSYYKEQFTKLQKENDELKKGGAVAATPSSAATAAAPAAVPVAAPAPASVEVSVADAIADLPAEAAAIVAETKPPEVLDVSSVVDDDLMAEFAKAVEMQKSGGAPAVAATPAAPVKPSPAPVAPPAPEPAAPAAVAEDSSPQSLVDEALAAAASEGVSSPQVEPANPLEQESIDLDKMVDEASGISTDGPEVNLEEALGDSINEDKILAEATALEVPSEDKKLMGDFENFVKNE